MCVRYMYIYICWQLQMSLEQNKYLQATALPQVARGRVEVRLRGADLGHGLDVAVGVGRHLVPDLLAACTLHGIAERTGRRRVESAVGRDTSGEDDGGGDLLVHLDGICKNFFVEQKFDGRVQVRYALEQLRGSASCKKDRVDGVWLSA